MPTRFGPSSKTNLNLECLLPTPQKAGRRRLYPGRIFKPKLWKFRCHAHHCSRCIDKITDVSRQYLHPGYRCNWLEWRDFPDHRDTFSAFGKNIFESALFKIDPDGNLFLAIWLQLPNRLLPFTAWEILVMEVLIAGEINELMVMNEQVLFVLKSDSWGDITSTFINIILPAYKFHGTVYDRDDMIVRFLYPVSPGLMIQISIPIETVRT